MPYNYADLPYCQPPSSPSSFASLGSKLQGGGPSLLPYAIAAGADVECKRLCQTELSVREVRKLRSLVAAEYRVHYSLDSLPSVMSTTLGSGASAVSYALRGFPVGFLAPPSLTGLAASETAIYNHVRFTIRYHEDAAAFEGLRVVGFETTPFSVDHRAAEGELGDPDATLSTCAPGAPAQNDPANFMLLPGEGALTVLFT